MKIKLGLLSKWERLGYDTTIEVALIANGDSRLIGVCNITNAADGSHVGELNLNEGISKDFYLYYKIGEVNDMQWLFGLDIMDHQHQDRQTVQLKEIEVD